jgi:hypothetical protein
VIGLAMILAGLSRCSVATLCPTDDQILTAVRNRDNDMVFALSNQAARDDPNSITLIHTLRIKRISDVVCGDALPSDLPGDPPTVNCKFTVRYSSKDAFTVAKMVQKEGQWKIADSLMVTRQR